LKILKIIFSLGVNHVKIRLKLEVSTWI